MSEETGVGEAQTEATGSDANEPVLTAEVVTELRPMGYSERQIQGMTLKYSYLKPIEPGDLCCHCQQDCDGPGFSVAGFTAYRVRGHPFCARPLCYEAHLDEFTGKRRDCRCGQRKGNI